MNIVIGSGPAGVACAQALASQGEPVTILDVGIELEPEIRSRVDPIAGRGPGAWTAADVKRLRGEVRPHAGGLIRKLVHGSDFPYRTPESVDDLEASNVALVPSHARGGLSNVWGAAILPWETHDFDEWPISRREMEPHYREALGMMPVSAVRDDLADAFPLFCEPDGALDPGRQGNAILGHLDAHRDQLAARGIRHGRSRLAVQVGAGDGRSGCVYCTQCLVGCPYRLIYNAADTLAELVTSGQVVYEDGVVVEELAEEEGHTLVRGRRLRGDGFEKKAARAFLAAGVINTTRILLRSAQRYGQPVRVQDSRYLLLPLLGTATPGSEHHTLSQVFLEVDVPEISPRRIHLQLYGHNTLYGDAVRAALGPLRGLLLPAIRPFERRLLAIQGYLHSDLSPGIALRLSKSGNGDRLTVEAEDDQGSSEAVIRRLGRHLLKNASAIGALPLLPLLKPGEPGRGFHSGGSFPMSADPGRSQCDPLGRPPGFDRVHVVDSTLLPAIPAGPITLTVMANAIRIARRVGPETIGGD